MVGDFNTPLSITDRPVRHRINKEIQDLNTINNLDLMDHPTTK